MKRKKHTEAWYKVGLATRLAEAAMTERSIMKRRVGMRLRKKGEERKKIK